MGGLDCVCLTVFGHILFTPSLPIYITHMYMYWAQFTYIGTKDINIYGP